MPVFRITFKSGFLAEARGIRDIIEGCIHAKRDSQRTFYKMYYSFSMSVCMRYCTIKEDALEVVNDGFLKIFRQLDAFIPRYQYYEVSLKAWMKSIFIHTAIDYYRKNYHSQHHAEVKEDHFTEADRSENAVDKMSYLEIIKLVQKLSPVYRTVFNLYVIDGFKHEEIAAKLNISVGTSKSNLSKARANIQNMLKKADIYHYERRAV